jgi:hypothetical protein
MLLATEHRSRRRQPTIHWFKRAVRSRCGVPTVFSLRYHEEDLSKGESVCINRCVTKFNAVHDLVKEKMQEQQTDAAAAQQGQ